LLKGHDFDRPIGSADHSTLAYEAAGPTREVPSNHTDALSFQAFRGVEQSG
jgi:hypothetical protein